jgi:hypothetical protein
MSENRKLPRQTSKLEELQPCCLAGSAFGTNSRVNNQFTYISQHQTLCVVYILSRRLIFQR